MKLIYALMFALFLTCAGCSGKTLKPMPGTESTEQAVERSLATVDPAASIHLFDYDWSAPLDIQRISEHNLGGVTQIDFTYASINNFIFISKEFTS